MRTQVWRRAAAASVRGTALRSPLFLRRFAASSLRRAHVAILENDDTTVSQHRERAMVGRRPITALLPAVAVDPVAAAACSYSPLATRARQR